MDSMGEQFFTHAGLADNQHVGIGAGDAANLFLAGPGIGTVAQDVMQTVFRLIGRFFFFIMRQFVQQQAVTLGQQVYVLHVAEQDDAQRADQFSVIDDRNPVHDRFAPIGKAMPLADFRLTCLQHDRQTGSRFNFINVPAFNIMGKFEVIEHRFIEPDHFAVFIDKVDSDRHMIEYAKHIFDKFFFQRCRSFLVHPQRTAFLFSTNILIRRTAGFSLPVWQKTRARLAPGPLEAVSPYAFAGWKNNLSRSVDSAMPPCLASAVMTRSMLTA